MAVSIELPDQLLEALESRAREPHSSVQAIAIEAIEKDIARSGSQGARGRRGATASDSFGQSGIAAIADER